jgi:chromosome segregation ATPase
MATRAELEAALAHARAERDRGDAEDSQGEADREKARAEWERTRADYYKARDDWESVRDKLDSASPEYEKARAQWTQVRTDWERVDAEYFRIRTEDAGALEERHRRRVEREAAYNAASDALDQLINADMSKRRALEEALAKATAERDTATVKWETAKTIWTQARSDWNKAIAEWEQATANWQKSRDALEEFNRGGTGVPGIQTMPGVAAGNAPFPTNPPTMAGPAGTTPFPRRGNNTQ